MQRMYELPNANITENGLWRIKEIAQAYEANKYLPTSQTIRLVVIAQIKDKIGLAKLFFHFRIHFFVEFDGDETIWDCSKLCILLSLADFDGLFLSQ